LRRDEAELEADAGRMIAERADAFGMTLSLPVATLRDDCLLAQFQHGEPLRSEQGYPLRLIEPGWEGATEVEAQSGGRAYTGDGAQ
jgi:sulfane dehydrogenase subunit SoxC